jgi:hypothetical protein
MEPWLRSNGLIPQPKKPDLNFAIPPAIEVRMRNFVVPAAPPAADRLILKK